MASLSSEIVVEGISIQTVADHTGRAAEALRTASKRLAQANRHERWRCNQRYTVTDQVTKLTVASERIAKYLDQVSTILHQGVSEIDATEKELRARMGKSEPLNLG